MKLVLALLLPILTVDALQAQDNLAIPIEHADAMGISIAHLDSVHGPALAEDPSESVFPARQEEVKQEWGRLLGAFSHALQERGFAWSEPMRAYFRFYFRADESIAQVMYGVRDLEGDRATAYDEALEEFVRSYRFSLTADRGFAQCSPATLVPPGES